MTPAIYTAYHKPSPLLQSQSVRPIHVGRAQAAAPLEGMIGDDTGDHISGQNREYCELTALYWAWKNDTESTHIGLMHYRRVLDFDGQFEGTGAELYPSRFDIPTWVQSAESWLADQGGSYDLVVPRMHVVGRTLQENYRKNHAPADLDLTRDIIAAAHPDYLGSFDTVSQQNGVRLGNMFVMRRDLMDRYCAWLFDILGKLEGADVDRSWYSPRQCRYLGFVAERLMTVYVHHLQAEDAGLRVHEVAIVNSSQALLTPYVADERMNGPAHVNIAFSADRAYLPHTAAMLQSMLTRADPARQMNLFFLYSDIGVHEMGQLEEVVSSHPNAQLHPLNVRGAFDASYRSSSRAPSNATYNRFLLFELLPSLERLLYVDVDMIFHGDVCEVFDIDMGDAQIAAVTDYIMTRTLTGPTPTRDPDVPDLYAYHRDRLGLSDAQIGRYFNAGLMLLNFKAMDVHATGQALFQEAVAGRYLFRDQDILNRHFKDRLLVLDGRYNVFNTVGSGYDRVPAPNFAAAMAARKAPFVTHYAAGDYKPWNAVSVPRAQYYWQALIQTPFYSEVISKFGKQRTQPRPEQPVTLRHKAEARMIEGAKAMATRFPALRPALTRGYQRVQWMFSK